MMLVRVSVQSVRQQSRSKNWERCLSEYQRTVQVMMFIQQLNN